MNELQKIPVPLTSKARGVIERIMADAPVKEPEIKPATSPTREAPTRRRSPKRNPWTAPPHINPRTMPKPKAKASDGKAPKNRIENMRKAFAGIDAAKLVDKFTESDITADEFVNIVLG